MSRNEFCTLFDANYLPRGLVLYRSLEAACGEFHLRVLCMDAHTKRLLDRLALPHLSTIAFAELEASDRELLSVKGNRSPVEYCWTATPCLCRYALETDASLDMITYLDADLMFYSDPAPLFDELGDGSIMIVPHRYPDRWRRLELRDGRYNVGWLTFRRDVNGLSALRWWRDRCLEWCFDRSEIGRFGDQKYLDQFPERFTGVRVLEHRAAGVAPWNSGRYKLEWRDGRLLIDGEPLIFYHYQSFRLVRGMTVALRLGIRPPHIRRLNGLAWSLGPWWWVDKHELALHWDHYARRVAAEVARLRELEPDFDGGVATFGATDYALALYGLARQLIPAGARA